MRVSALAGGNVTPSKQKAVPEADFATILAAEQQKEAAQLKKACQDLEAFFVQQIFKQMRATIPQSGFLPESMATQMYEEMLDSEYSRVIAESPRGLGLAEMLYEQLKPTIKELD